MMSNLHKAIHGARKRLGLDEETTRDFYQRTVGKRGLTQMTADEHARVLEAMNAVQPPGRGRTGVDGPYGKKLQALWIDAWHLGIVESRDDAALLAFVERQTGVSHTRFLREAEVAEKAVEGLKAWIGREGGVVWAGAPADAVIRAQVGKLADRPEICERARKVLGRGVPKPMKLAMMRELGALIRRRRPARRQAA